MTVFAICMTALSAFLLGLMCGKRMETQKPSISKSHKPKEVANKRIVNEEYLNFLNYDGTEQS